MKSRTFLFNVLWTVYQVHTGPNETLTLFETVFFYIAETIDIQDSRSLFVLLLLLVFNRTTIRILYCVVSRQKRQCLRETLQTAKHNIHSKEFLSCHGMLSPLPAALLLYKHWCRWRSPHGITCCHRCSSHPRHGLQLIPQTVTAAAFVVVLKLCCL